jgi:tetratricopeptide (TPR) repeat protein
MQNPKAAETYLQKALDIDPNRAEAIGALVQSARVQKFSADSVSSILNLAAKHENSPGLQMAAGDVLSESGDASKATGFYESAYKQSGQYPQIGLKLAGIYKAQGNLQEASRYLSEVSTTLKSEIAKRTNEGIPSSMTKQDLLAVNIDLAKTMTDAKQFDQARLLLDEIEKDMDPKVYRSLRDRIPN